MQHCLQYRKSGALTLLWALHTCATARSMLVNNWKEHLVKHSRNIIAWVVEKYLNLWFDHENGLADLSGQISQNFIQKYSKKKTIGPKTNSSGIQILSPCVYIFQMQVLSKAWMARACICLKKMEVAKIGYSHVHNI
jgi:hypothetical protein